MSSWTFRSFVFRFFILKRRVNPWWGEKKRVVFIVVEFESLEWTEKGLRLVRIENDSILFRENVFIRS